MIVACQSCKTSFRVPDGRIGPRGAKVRCSRCKAVFILVPGEPAAPGPGLDLDLASPPPPPQVDDPFARAAPPPPPFPRGATPPPLPMPAGPLDPFGSPLLGDPFAPSPVAATPAPSDRLAARSAGPVAAPSDPFAALAAPAPAVGTAPGPDPFAHLPALSDPAPGPTPPPHGSGISLEEAQNRIPVSHAPPGLEAIDAVEARADFRTPGPSGLEVEERAEAAPPAEVPAATPPRPTRAPPAAPAPAEAPPPAPRRARRSGLLALVVNSLSLALLLALAGVLYASWKGMGQAALWPSGSRQEPALAAREVRAGLYETARGKPVLCIRGRVEARSATGGPVKVLVDVVRGGRTVARVEALAGAVPTPEEVWLLDGAASAEKLRAALAPRAAPRLGQGESQPFLAVLWDFPEELRGLDLRVVAEPAPAG